MNIFNFTEQKDSDKEYKYKVLVYPNITYMKDLEKDSYSAFKELITFINNITGSKDEVNEEKLKNSIKSTSFESLENKEKIGEFKENVFSRSNKKVKFFYLGSKNKWQKLLPERIKKEANNLFENDLKFFNY